MCFLPFFFFFFRNFAVIFEFLFKVNCCEPVLFQVISRYEKEFGARNYQFSAGKVDFVVVDAQTLDGEYFFLQ